MILLKRDVFDNVLYFSRRWANYSNRNMDYENTHRVYYYLTFVYFTPGDTNAPTTPKQKKLCVSPK